MQRHTPVTFLVIALAMLLLSAYAASVTIFAQGSGIPPTPVAGTVPVVPAVPADLPPTANDSVVVDDMGVGMSLRPRHAQADHAPQGADPDFITFLPTIAGAPVEPIAYTSFDGLELQLYPFEGEHVVVLAPYRSANFATMARMLEGIDAAWESYAMATGREPTLIFEHNGKGTIASAPTTCQGMGAGCGYLGHTGIELTDFFFARLYDGIRDHNEFDQPVFYEMGRNFWFYGSQIEYRDSDNTGTITTGYAVFMRFLSMDAAGVEPGPFNWTDFAYFRAEVEGMADRYLADSSLSWENTLKIGAAPENPLGLGATDLFASFLFKLKATYGAEFIPRLWHAVDTRPEAATTQDAVDSFVVSASIAADANLVSLFRDEWRWPVSENAVEEIQRLFAQG